MSNLDNISVAMNLDLIFFRVETQLRGNEHGHGVTVQAPTEQICDKVLVLVLTPLVLVLVGAG